MNQLRKIGCKMDDLIITICSHYICNTNRGNLAKFLFISTSSMFISTYLQFKCSFSCFDLWPSFAEKKPMWLNSKFLCLPKINHRNTCHSMSHLTRKLLDKLFFSNNCMRIINYNYSK